MRGEKWITVKSAEKQKKMTSWSIAIVVLKTFTGSVPCARKSLTTYPLPTAYAGLAFTKPEYWGNQ